MHDKAIPNTLREVNTTLAFVFQIPTPANKAELLERGLSSLNALLISLDTAVTEIVPFLLIAAELLPL